MSLAGLNFTSLALSPVAPVSGRNYTVVNLAYRHFLHNPSSATKDQNPVTTWDEIVNVLPNLIWKYLTYPSSDGATVFTLQVLSTIQSNPSAGAVIDSRGGYLRVDPKTNKLVHGGQPQAWKLVSIANMPSIYKIAPFESAFNPNGTLVATDMSKDINHQLELHDDTGALEQLWIFSDD